MTLVGSGKNAVDEELNPRYGLGPDEWLAYLASARFVLTDSLHGTLFSQIFRKDYYCFKRFEETDKRSQNSRVESLARLSNTEDRLLDGYESHMHATEIEGYERRLSDVESLISFSKNWLLDALEQ